MNRLANSTSPYLQQHAANPVDWQPWDAAALAQAKAEDKPIFISIGYATCHWCHVMAHESFENEQVAAELNRCCVCIKVDREEMPQIDQLYMRACQLMTGSGGWPLNLALTPDGRPFFAATYIRPNSSFGQLGMLDLPGRFAASWQEHRNEVEARADLIVEHMQAAPTGGMDFGPELYDQSSAQLKSAFDREFGGFGTAPKFPSCHNLLFLLGCFEKQGDQAALDMVNQTLMAIRKGGIYDQLGYGLHRYATDQAWQVPHFEKMLYDQAMLILTCSEAYRLNQDERFKLAGLDTATYVLRDLRLENGACATAEDADSEGHEGRFYVWTLEQVRQLLNEAELAILTQAFKLAQRGNFAEIPGANILAVSGELDEALRAEFEPVRLKLLAARAQRVRPLRDDKILCDLNAMTVVALAAADRSFGAPELHEAAQAILDWLLANYKTADGLLHCAGQPSLLDDWAWLGLACLEMQRPELAGELADAMLARFREDDRLYLTDQNAPNLIARPSEAFDNATPCGNSVAIALLARLGQREARFRQAAAELLAGLNGQLHPGGHGFLLWAARQLV